MMDDVLRVHGGMMENYLEKPRYLGFKNPQNLKVQMLVCRILRFVCAIVCSIDLISYFNSNFKVLLQFIDLLKPM